jgi:hypothetical protein
MSDTRDQPRKDRPLPDWKNVFVECLQEREMALFFPDGPSADPSDVFDAALVAVKAMAKPPRTETLRAYYAMGLVLRLRVLPDGRQGLHGRSGEANELRGVHLLGIAVGRI